VRLAQVRISYVRSAPISWSCWRILETVHISPHVIYAVLTQEALNPFIECMSGLLAAERLSITLELGPKLAIEHVRFLPGSTQAVSYFRLPLGHYPQNDLTRMP
jgi:hypothetical protein